MQITDVMGKAFSMMRPDIVVVWEKGSERGGHWLERDKYEKQIQHTELLYFQCPESNSVAFQTNPSPSNPAVLREVIEPLAGGRLFEFDIQTAAHPWATRRP